jgi:hypothetical protein
MTRYKCKTFENHNRQEMDCYTFQFITKIYCMPYTVVYFGCSVVYISEI